MITTNYLNYLKDAIAINSALTQGSLSHIQQSFAFFDVHISKIIPFSLKGEWNSIYEKVIQKIPPDQFRNDRPYIVLKWKQLFQQFIAKCSDKMYPLRVEQRSGVEVHGFTPEQLLKKRRIYNALENGKWLEGVEYCLHEYGPKVFDKGLHKGDVEPGFLENWQNATHFLAEKMDSKFSSSLYLQLHKITCAHFTGKETQTLIGQEKIGVFRDSEDDVCWHIRLEIKPEALKELEELNQKIYKLFDVDLANFQTDPNTGATTLVYTQMPRETMTKIFDFFVENFHEEMNQAADLSDRLTAIARLIRNMEWSHSVQDGCGRCDTLIMNFLLTQYGFTPAIINPSSYICNVIGLKEWVEILKSGMVLWLKHV
jgi:hypothetical protein